MKRILPSLLLAALAAVAPGPGHAAGMTTHAFMADTGRQGLEDGVLKQILTVHRPALLAGALYPDGGYGSGTAFPADRDMAEHAHWGQFHIAFVDYLRERGCAAQASEAARLFNLPVPLPAGSVQVPVGTLDIAGLTDECGMLIAFAFGAAAHGITDETWDAQFEPEVRDRGEDPNIVHFLDAGEFWGPLAPGSLVRLLLGDDYGFLSQVWAATPLNGIEYTMDVVAIVEHGLTLNSPLLVFPPTAHLAAVYARSHFRDRDGNTTVQPLQIERANIFSRAAVQAQADSAAVDYQRVRAHMPWASNNYFLEAGGVVSSGRSVAAMYQDMWQRLLTGRQSAAGLQVAGHYPAHGQTGVRLRKAEGHWIDHRWIHVFFDAEVDPASIEQPGAMQLYDARGRIVDTTVEGGHGWSREWSHSTRLRLNQDLLPNTRYTVALTRQVKDWSGRRLARPYRWQFVTAAP